MSSEENSKNLPPESAPDPGVNSRPLEDAPGSSERPEEQLGQRLGDTADSVTQQLRDLQDELIPPSEPFTPAARVPSSPEPAVTEQPPSSGTEEVAASQGTGFVPEFPPSPPPPRGPAPTTEAPEGTNDDRLLSMLAWLSMVIFQLPVVAIIQLLSEYTKDRPFQRHHAITSLLFYVAGVVYEVLAVVVYAILTGVTFGCAGLCLWVIFFLPHALALYYAFQAYSGKRVELPYLSEFGRRQGWL